VHPVIDPSILAIILAILTGGIGREILVGLLDRWKQASGKKRTTAQREAEWREALARARFMLSEHGVPEEDLPDYPD